MHDRRPELGGKIGRLIESSSETFPGVQRHGDDTARVGRDVVPRLTQQLAEPGREPSAPFVLEGMNDFPQGALIVAGRTRHFERAWSAPASGTALRDEADDSP